MSDLSYSGPVARLGHIDVWECGSCGAAITSMDVHTRWHETYTEVVDGAMWGSMNRPIGGL